MNAYQNKLKAQFIASSHATSKNIRHVGIVQKSVLANVFGWASFVAATITNSPYVSHKFYQLRRKYVDDKN